MRVVYGAGAVAVASVIAVGLVQPDFTATADQQATTDPNLADQGQNQQVADAGNGNGNGRTDQSNNSGTANTQVKHVTKYIQLKPGQTAPRGATVIPGQPPAVAANNPGSAAHNPPPAAHNPPPVTHNPPPVNNPPPVVHNPPPAPPPPPVKTHQSGHP